MNILGQIGSKIVWAVIIIVLAIAGYIWAVNTLLKTPAVSPPPVASAPPEPPTAPSSTPSPSNSPAASAPSPTPSYSSAPEPTSAASPESSPTTTPLAANPTSSPVASIPSPSLVPNSNNSEPITDSSSSPQPALALPDQPTLKVPSKLERGGLLYTYINNDGNDKPDPMMYSPSRVLKTDGVVLADLPRGQFQEIKGYFLASQTGNYNFTVAPLEGYISLSDLHMRIDGSMLSTTRGGKATLERGWHQVALFTDLQNASPINVTWGREGEILKPLQVWREAK